MISPKAPTCLPYVNVKQDQYIFTHNDASIIRALTQYRGFYVIYYFSVVYYFLELIRASLSYLGYFMSILLTANTVKLINMVFCFYR